MRPSRYYLADLHVHSPRDKASKYGAVQGREAEFCNDFIERHRGAGVEVVAVTDHNSLEWAERLMQASAEYRDFFVFPGLEFSVNGCHLVALWDRNSEGLAAASSFLGYLFPPGVPRFDSGGSPRPTSEGQVHQLVVKAQEYGAVVIAPHATMSDIGLFGAVKDRSLALSAIQGFDVIGYSKRDVLANPKSEFGDRLPPWIMTGDLRSLDGAGERACFLKMDQPPTLEGVRQALLLPETRVRLRESHRALWGHTKSVHFSADPRLAEHPRITRIRISGGFHDGLDVELGPGLNAIIGGKGTGKSALTGILRHALEATGAAPAEVSTRKFALPASAETLVEFVDPTGERCELRRFGTEAPSKLQSLDRDEDLDLRVSQRLNVTVFGHRQLEELADKDRSSAARHEQRREFVASQRRREWHDALALVASAVDELSRNDRELGEVEGRLSLIRTKREDLDDVNDQLTRAAQFGASDLLAESATYASVDQEVERIPRWLHELEHTGRSLSEISPPTFADDLNSDAINRLRNSVVATDALAEGLNDALRRSISAVRRQFEDAQPAWASTLAAAQERISQELAAAGVESPDELTQLQRRQARLASEIEGESELLLRLKGLESERRDLLTSLEQAVLTRSNLLEDCCSHLDAVTPGTVRVELRRGADRSAFLAEIKALLAASGAHQSQQSKVAQALTPRDLADLIRQSDTVALQTASGCSEDASAKLCELGEPECRRLEQAVFADEIELRVAIDQAGQTFRDVESCSSGQRATALLTLALANGSHPLVIDQPEDDLDNRYILQDVVEVLRSTCERRQVIVVTHNANIPVLGDADTVVAFTADDERSQVLASGGFESAEVARHAKEILEGGGAAFEQRERRYRLGHPI